MNDRAAAIEFAAKMLARPDVLILDTETTGLDGDAEICQVAIMTIGGRPVLDALVRPTRPIPPDAQRVHGISDADVAGAPTFVDLMPALRAILGGRTVLIYNVEYDTRLLVQSARACGLDLEAPPFGAEYLDAMIPYSAYIGEPGRYGGYRWQRLPGGDHSAMGDCKATLKVLQEMRGNTDDELF